MMGDSQRLLQNALDSMRELEEKNQPFTYYDMNEFEQLPIFPFPKIKGTPKGWKLLEMLLADKTGLAGAEPALSRSQLRVKIRNLLTAHGVDQIGFGKGAEGHYVVYVKTFKRT